MNPSDKKWLIYMLLTDNSFNNNHNILIDYKYKSVDLWLCGLLYYVISVSFINQRLRLILGGDSN